MIRILRRAGLVAALCLLASTTPGVASASPQADSVQTFRNPLTNGCLDFNRVDRVRSFPCNGGAWQQWRVHVWADNTRRLQNVATGYCLTYNGLGGDTVDAASVCDASTTESWYIQYPRIGGIAFQNQYQGGCVSATHGVYVTSCDTNDPAQNWF
ncbi:ricin-type beta-trefoil lectin domain protein [Streptomyces sp. NPDC005385]|uniref:RICIN domain-containing protein n=1 Tax=Streptomyces sp. NPDC005385 TaxID=3157039 RepID=UPI00339FB64D